MLICYFHLLVILLLGFQLNPIEFFKNLRETNYNHLWFSLRELLSFLIIISSFKILICYVGVHEIIEFCFPFYSMQEKLWSMLRDVLRNKQPNVDVVKLQRSGGVVSRNSKYRQRTRSYRIRVLSSFMILPLLN